MKQEKWSRLKKHIEDLYTYMTLPINNYTLSSSSSFILINIKRSRSVEVLKAH